MSSWEARHPPFHLLRSTEEERPPSPPSIVAVRFAWEESVQKKKECAGHQQWVDVQVCDVYCVLAAMVLPLTCFWCPSMWTSIIRSSGFYCMNLAASNVDA
ncbi:hypothetical protein Taro_028943 [Colocasia esculenta]|uniref:Uncharacterized protein n=1 Tax=Colocasia esculenta TaxID=4460 RepID=A0A843VIK3_COLES|nr:hypothetical protein [Colocasia esculenta]